jgi:uncharacterized protein YggE
MDRDATPKSIVVVGQGSATVTPDAAVLRVGLEVRADTASQALAGVTDRAQAVLAATKGQGADEGDVQTQGVALYPQMDTQGRRVVAYLASYSLSVRLGELSSAPAVVDAVSQAAGDALRLGGFHLSTADSEAARNDAAARAVEDARGRAERLATAAGVRLGRVLAINEMGAMVPPQMVPFARRAVAAAGPASAAVPMEAGSENVVVRVTVTFEIAD